MDLASLRFWPWWLAGGVIGLIAAVHPLLLGRPLGVSALYKDLLERLRGRDVEAPSAEPTVETEEELVAAFAAATLEEFGEPEPGTSAPPAPPASLGRALVDLGDGGRGRPLFLLGIVLGGALTRVWRGGWAAPWSLGRHFDARFLGLGAVTTALVLLAAGVCIGFGTRLAGGCTSGHGISGVACGQRGSLLSTATFWGVGAGVAWLLLEAAGR